MEQVKTIFEIFNSPAAIHLKYMNLHYYAIKRLTALILNPDDYNPEGGGRDLMY
jgi:hypothetical protein